jgi:hypothetical protein
MEIEVMKKRRFRPEGMRGFYKENGERGRVRLHPSLRALEFGNERDASSGNPPQRDKKKD